MRASSRKVSKDVGLKLREKAIGISCGGFYSLSSRKEGGNLNVIRMKKEKSDPSHGNGQ